MKKTVGRLPAVFFFVPIGVAHYEPLECFYEK